MADKIACPTWFDHKHILDPAVGAVHHLALSPVPVVALDRLTRVTTATEFDVAAFCHVDEVETWVVIASPGPRGQRLEVSMESAHRLRAGLSELLRRVG